MVKPGFEPEGSGAFAPSAGGAKLYLIAHSGLDRRAYRLLIEQELKLRVEVESDFAPVSVWAAMKSRPTVAIAWLDPVTNLVRDSMQMIPRLAANVRLLGISSITDRESARVWHDYKLDGYVVKDGGIDELRAAVTALQQNRQYFGEAVRQALQAEGAAAAAPPRLSRRESELLPMLARGMTLREAAEAMTVSYKTADAYRTSLLRKLGVKHRVQLTRYAIRNGLIEP